MSGLTYLQGVYIRVFHTSLFRAQLGSQLDVQLDEVGTLKLGRFRSWMSGLAQPLLITHFARLGICSTKYLKGATLSDFSIKRNYQVHRCWMGRGLEGSLDSVPLMGTHSFYPPWWASEISPEQLCLPRGVP
ncbi:hypothetical protein B0H16DRAFT_1459118 [Mycena metata]|uniref:Uncharacterized protein n=1 Tax=Mycena metata TaxID=1033252 RepID=A0AAD7NBM7_9AGAR|nr:hypothetical protein B0H16DRAFT_1459118 [Mycena metata]